MSLLPVNTVDRLDRPSAYYVGKVSIFLAKIAKLLDSHGARLHWQKAGTN